MTDDTTAPRTRRAAYEATVVIPTRNRRSILVDAALRAALAQEQVDHEIVVVDDGSTDGTPDELEALGEPRLRVVRHERALGVAHARNAGIRAARGAWVAFLDDDDVWSPLKLRKQLDAGSTQSAAFVYAASVALDPGKRFLFGHAPPDPSTLATQLMRRNVMWGGCSNVVVRTDVVRELGGFDEELFQLADWDLWIRLAVAARPAVCREVLVGCVVHQESMLLRNRRDVFIEFDYLARKHRSAAGGDSAAFDPALFARWVAGGHVRAGRRREAARALLRGRWSRRRLGNLVRLPGAILGRQAMEAGRSVIARIPGHVPPDEHTAVEPPWLARYW